jgi:hypothetical protein
VSDSFTLHHSTFSCPHNRRVFTQPAGGTNAALYSCRNRLGRRLGVVHTRGAAALCAPDHRSRGCHSVRAESVSARGIARGIARRRTQAPRYTGGLRRGVALPVVMLAAAATQRITGLHIIGASARVTVGLP